MSMFGGGFEGSDPNLHDKIAKLKAKRGAQSGKQRVDEFLEKELHVDPRDLPFTLDAANARMNEIMSGNGSGLADVVGNSLGLKAVVFKSAQIPNPPNGCPNCGSKTAGGYWDNVSTSKGEGDWICYDCDENSHVTPLPDTTLKTATDNDHSGEDWHDLQRCWKAFTGALKYPDPCPKDVEQRTVYSFRAQLNHYYGTTATTEAVETPVPEPDLSKYPTGATLRIQKATFKAGDVDVERMYVRIGGLFNDTDVVNLTTMQPINDVSGWTVVEEL